MNVPFSPPDIGRREIELAVEALRSGWITTGPKTKQFEREIAAYTGAAGAACLSSATAAMELTLRLLGVGPGDEVVVPAYTYTATASVVCHVGATPVMADTAPGGYHVSPKEIARAITAKTKAVIPVDIAGIPADYPAVFAAVEEKKGLFAPANEWQAALGRAAVIADGAHSFGGSQNGAMCGAIADFTCFSFHAVKNLTTAEGGAVTWKPFPGVENDRIYQQFMLLSLHGQTKDALAKTKAGSWEYDVASPAYKCNMTDINAAIGLAQMERYANMLARRRELIGRYDAAFAGTILEAPAHYGAGYASSGHLYLSRLAGKSMAFRNRLIGRLAEEGVAANVHYKPLPLLTAYKNMGFRMEDYPNAWAQFQNEITLPLYSKLTDEQQGYVVERVLAGIE